MKTNVSRKTINTYIYLKKPCSADKQVHMMKASNNNYYGFYAFFDLLKWKDLKWLNVKVYE